MLDSDEDNVMVIKFLFAAYYFYQSLYHLHNTLFSIHQHVNMDTFFLEKIMDAKMGML